MRPAARYAAAADVLDRVAQGMAAEQSLLKWSRNARYAGSKDRAAVRDITFDVLRAWQTCIANGGGASGRALILGLLRWQDGDVESVFTGGRHDLGELTPEERALLSRDPSVRLDVPDWLEPPLQNSLGNRFDAFVTTSRHRAPVCLRVNLAKCSLEDAQARLLDDGIRTAPVDDIKTALQVIDPKSKIHLSGAYIEGWVELQDASSQAAMLRLGPSTEMRVLDYCAGGGGKSLALAGLGIRNIDAHDAAPQRMKDLPERAARANARINRVAKPTGRYDLVLCDVPCSGSGTWRRTPEAKWRLTPQRLDELTRLQKRILSDAARYSSEKGILAYTTCSVIDRENIDNVEDFLRENDEWSFLDMAKFEQSDTGDGFFVAKLIKK